MLEVVDLRQIDGVDQREPGQRTGNDRKHQQNGQRASAGELAPPRRDCSGAQRGARPSRPGRAQIRSRGTADWGWQPRQEPLGILRCSKARMSSR